MQDVPKAEGLTNVIHVFKPKKKVDSKIYMEVTLGDLRENHKWFIRQLMRSQEKKSVVTRRQQNLFRIGHMSLYSFFPLIILPYQNMDFNNVFYKVPMIVL